MSMTLPAPLPAASSRLRDFVPPRVRIRNAFGRAFRWICFGSTWFALVVLVVLLIGVSYKAWGWLDWQFLTSFDSYRPKRAGLLAGLWGSMWLMMLTTLIAVPIGVAAAVYLEEYSRGNWLTRLIQLNIANLAGIPSIVYGILGLTVFVRMFGLFENRDLNLLERAVAVVVRPVAGLLHIPLPLGSTVLAGALTLSLLVLPVIIISTQEALRSIPASLRHASYALGATKWQTIRHQVLPAAVPGILTGVILALSRAVGETAPLVIIGVPTYLAATPGNIASVGDLASHPSGLLEAPFSMFTALPMIVFNWVRQAKPEFQNLASAGIVVLMGLLLAMNSAAILVRQRFQKRIRW
jgi:phosphate transport system permease protein